MFTLQGHDLPLYWQDSEIDSDIIIDHPEKYEYKKIQTIFLLPLLKTVEMTEEKFQYQKYWCCNIIFVAVFKDIFADEIFDVFNVAFSMEFFAGHGLKQILYLMWNGAMDYF